jgi:hypothetical protein
VARAATVGNEFRRGRSQRVFRLWWYRFAFSTQTRHDWLRICLILCNRYVAAAWLFKGE